MKYIPFLFLPLVIFTCSNLHSQQTHFDNTVKYLREAAIKERSTFDHTSGKKLVTVDRYQNGNKIETFEYYYGDRFLSKFNGSAWVDAHDTTHYGFSYDNQGRQIYQLNYDFKTVSENHMYRYDSYGNIERWETGRSFQLPHVLSNTYDIKGNLVKEKNCWSDSCFKNSSDMTESIHYLKYDANGMLSEDLVNYVDAMSGYTYSYKLDKQGRIIQKDQTRVWSYFGLDHEIPTMKDVDQTRLYYSWKYEYNVKDKLIKETRIEYWREVPKIYVMTYTELGLLHEQKIDEDELITYEYNTQGLMMGMAVFSISRNEQKISKKFTFDYSF